MSTRRVESCIESASPTDCAALSGLLGAAGLPHEDVGADSPLHIRVLRRMGEVQGGIGLEPVGRAGLLRSLVVHPDARGDGYGTALVRSIERYGRENGIERLYLLTTTATPFFERLGYKQTSRAAVPEAIAETDEFSRLCPDSATCMQKSLIS